VCLVYFVVKIFYKQVNNDRQGAQDQQRQPEHSISPGITSGDGGHVMAVLLDGMTVFLNT